MRLLETRDVRRAFGETQALASASLDVRPGETHALVGENGSGKSTFVKIITGVLRQDDGELLWDGVPRRFASPRQGHAAGIAAVFQETLVVDELSVLDNVLLGTDGLFRRGRDEAAAARHVAAILELLGLEDVGLETPMWQLSLSRRQMVTIARALARPWRLLVLDEATSALDVEDRDRLFTALERERERDAAVLLISHRMDEVRDLADRVTVMRSGRTVQTLDRADASTDMLLELMSSAVGDRRNGAHGHRSARRLADSAPVARARSIALIEGATPFDLDVRPGEILGLAGLQGHGQERLLRCLAGHDRPAAGALEVESAGEYVPIGGMRDAFRRRIAYVPGDRKREGLFAPLSVLDNQALPTLRRHAVAGVIRRRQVKAAAERAVERLRVVTAGVEAPIAGLSGGNQQKVLLSRWLAADPRVLLLNDPLRGVDLGARLEVCDIFRALADEDMAIVIYSTELEELLIASDRVAVLHEHTLATTLSGDELSHAAIISAMFGNPEVVEEVR